MYPCQTPPAAFKSLYLCVFAKKTFSVKNAFPVLKTCIFLADFQSRRHGIRNLFQSILPNSRANDMPNSHFAPFFAKLSISHYQKFHEFKENLKFINSKVNNLYWGHLETICITAMNEPRRWWAILFTTLYVRWAHFFLIWRKIHFLMFCF